MPCNLLNITIYQRKRISRLRLILSLLISIILRLCRKHFCINAAVLHRQFIVRAVFFYSAF